MGVGTGAKLINNKKCHVRTVGQPVMAGLGPPTPGPWHPLHPDRVEAAGSRGTLPGAPPPHWGSPGRVHRCWHPNEKVNIEPKDLGGG